MRRGIQYLLKLEFPRFSSIGDFCGNYKKWLVWYNCEHFYFKYVYFINKEKGKRKIKHANKEVFQSKCYNGQTSVTMVMIMFSKV